MKIFLTGYMGSGKSVIGKQLAIILGYPFYDTDAQISKGTNIKISDIFAEKGENFFRNLENEIMHQYFLLETNMIVATGVGLPCHNNLMHKMNQQGQTIYLKLDAELLNKRLKHQKMKRPLLSSQTDVLQFIKNTLKVREEVYNQASHIITITEPDKIHDVCQTILQTIHFNEERTKL